MRSILSVILAVLLTICPALCEAGGCGCDAPGGRSGGDQTSAILADVPCADADCPEDCGHPGTDSGDNCICQGAVRHDDDGPDGPVRVLGSLFPFPNGPAFITDGPHLPSTLFGASPTTVTVDPRTARALLQTYRC